MVQFRLNNDPQTKNTLKIKDISAGGCRIAILDDGQSKHCLEEEKSPDVFMFFRLKQSEDSVQELYVLGKIRVFFHEPASKGIGLGIQFTMQGTIASSTKKQITWKPLQSDEGLAEVDNWVFKQHLTLFRQKECDEEDI